MQIVHYRNYYSVALRTRLYFATKISARGHLIEMTSEEENIFNISSFNIRTIK